MVNELCIDDIIGKNYVVIIRSTEQYKNVINKLNWNSYNKTVNHYSHHIETLKSGRNIGIYLNTYGTYGNGNYCNWDYEKNININTSASITCLYIKDIANMSITRIPIIEVW